jgi:hypothetical protein
MARVALFCLLVVIAGCGSHPTIQNDGHVVGVFDCGGPSPGGCHVQGNGSVEVLSRHHVVASLGAKKGRFSVWLVPGRYTLVATSASGMRASRSVNATADQTTTANITIPVP